MAMDGIRTPLLGRMLSNSSNHTITKRVVVYHMVSISESPLLHTAKQREANSEDFTTMLR